MSEGGWSLDHKTRLRLRTSAWAGLDYALNVLILFGFAAAGTISADVAWKVLVAAVAFNVISLGGIATGFSKRLGDPSLTGIQVFAACAINLMALVLAPQIAYMFIVNLFVPLAFGGLHFSRRQFFAAWVIATASLGMILALMGERLGIALATPIERLLFWAVLTLAFGRFLAVNAEVSRLRARLHEQNKQLEAATRKLAELATRDELTGAWNRREFLKLLLAERERAERTGAGFCVALVDVDLFKEVNDRYGHLVGDVVLRRLAEVLAGSLRNADCLARYGGEEFGLLLIAATTADASTALERTRQVVESYDWDHQAPGLRLTVSAGVAAWRRGETGPEILSRADEALYAAKRAGRNRILAEPADSGISDPEKGRGPSRQG